MFRAKVEGMSSKNFLGVPPDPSFIVPCCIFVLSVRQVLISKTSGATWGLVYLECLGSGNSMGPHPDHSHLYCHTQIYLVCKNFRRKISPVCTSHTLQTGWHAIVILIFDIQHWDIGDTFATHSLQTVVGKVVVK